MAPAGATLTATPPSLVSLGSMGSWGDENATPGSSLDGISPLSVLPVDGTYATVSIDDTSTTSDDVATPPDASTPSELLRTAARASIDGTTAPLASLKRGSSSFIDATSSSVVATKRESVRPIIEPQSKDADTDQGQGEEEDEAATPVRAASTPTPRSVRYRVSSVDRALRGFLHLLTPATPVLDSQVYMTAGAITVSFLLVAFAVIFRLEVYDVTRMNAGLVFGSVGTLVMTAVILVHFAMRQWYHTRHMHILLMNLAVCEFLLALSFILEPVWRTLGAGVGAGRSCTWLSTVREYLIMGSTVWTTCMAVDLYYLMTDPFTSPRHNRRKYRAIANAVATLAAAVMGFFNAFDAPVAVGNFCWVGAKKEAQNDAQLASDLSIWLFIIAPVAVSMGITIYVTLASFNRFQDGTAATLQNRHVLLREGFLTTITFIVYSALLWGVYGGYWLASAATDTSEILSVLFAFLLSYRGSVAFILWCLYKKPARHGTSYAAAATGSTSSTNQDDDESSDEASEEAVRPQMNLALLNELVQFTTQGIARAIRMAPRASATTAGTAAPTPTPTMQLPEGGITNTKEATSNAHTFVLRSATSRFSAWNEIKFTDFYPATFARLRASFGIHDDAFLESLAKCTTPKVSEGASGSFMFYSRDRSFIVKSLTASESAFLHSMLGAYVDYVAAQPATFLTRFLGSFCIQLYGKRAYFVVMENVFDVQHGVSIHQRYDIKGSWIDRNAQKPTRGAEVTCRHCNLTFRHGTGRNICPNRAGSHEPNVVLKDMDLTTKLRFGPVEGKRLLKQLKRDSDFLCDLGIMDYSLLLGVIEVSYQVNRQNILTRDGSVFLDQLLSETSDVAAAESGPGMRTKQSTQCLRTSEVVIGPGFYYVGLIDILQTWTWSKRLERFIKSVLLRKDPDGISAMAPKAYRTRFHKKLDEIVHLGHNVVATPRNSVSEHEPHADLWRGTHILMGVPGTAMETDSGRGDAPDNGTSSGVLAGQVRTSQ